MIKITPAQLEIVKKIISQNAPYAEVRVFGSRVDGSPKPYSDLDLAVVAEKELSLAAIGHLKEAFEESDLPFRVDVLDWNSISESFRKIIAQKYEVLQFPKGSGHKNR